MWLSTEGHVFKLHLHQSYFRWANISLSINKRAARQHRLCAGGIFTRYARIPIYNYIERSPVEIRVLDQKIWCFKVKPTDICMKLGEQDTYNYPAWEMLITTCSEGTTGMIVSQTSICRLSSYGAKIRSKLLEDKDAYFREKDLARD